MGKKRHSSDGRSEELLATLITSTRTQKRGVSLIEFADVLEKAIGEAGSLEEVADRIDLSPRMLKQFLLVQRLSPAVRKLVAMRKIDSVDAVGYLIQFDAKSQAFLAKQLVDGKILTSDLRAVRQVHKEQPKEALGSIIERVVTSRTKKVYVLEFIFRGDLTEEKVAKKIREIVGSNGLSAVERSGSFGRVVLTADGLTRLRSAAAENGDRGKEPADRGRQPPQVGVPSQHVP